MYLAVNEGVDISSRFRAELPVTFSQLHSATSAHLMVDDSGRVCLRLTPYTVQIISADQTARDDPDRI
jgi:hypothetical protein